MRQTSPCHHDSAPFTPADERRLSRRLADWRAYAAAGATLAAAEAAIVYDDPTVKPAAKIGANTSNPFSIDGVGIRLYVTHQAGSREHVGASAIGGEPFFFFGGKSGGFSFFKNCQAGSAIGGGRLTSSDGFRVRNASGKRLGPFVTGQTGFAGFQLPASKGGGEGWLRVEVLDPAGNGGPNEIEAIDWAYNDAAAA